MDTIDMILSGHRIARAPERESILIDPAVRTRLRALLFEPEFHAVGYSAFIERAVEVAETALAQQRTANERGVRAPTGPEAARAHRRALLVEAIGARTGAGPNLNLVPQSAAVASGAWVGEGR